MRAKGLWGIFGFAALILSAPLACNGVLGITEATFDPTITSDSGSGGDTSTIGDASADGLDPFSCEAYCATVMQNCQGPNLEYISNDVCLSICAHFEHGPQGSQEGDTRECRIWHSIAAKDDPDFHCRHAGPTGGLHCGDNPCVPFCALGSALCTPRGVFPYDGGEGECRTACAGFPYLIADAGDLTLTAASNTLNCRL